MNKKQRLEIKQQLIDKFSDLVFEEDIHKYYLKSNPEYKFKGSVSKLSEKVKEPFDLEKHSKNRAKELGISQDDVKKQWKEKNTKSLVRGTAIHKELELHTEDNRRKASETTKKINRWLIDSGYRLIANELRMFDTELGYSGTLDILAYNVNDKCFHILDYKTNNNKSFDKIETYIDKRTGLETYSNFKLLKPFDKYPKSKYYEYSIQLSAYKYLLEKHSDIKIKSIIFIHISDQYTEKFKVIEGCLMNVECLFKM